MAGTPTSVRLREMTKPETARSTNRYLLVPQPQKHLQAPLPERSTLSEDVVQATIAVGFVWIDLQMDERTGSH